MIDGTESSCLEFGRCQSCGTTCSATASCYESCKSNGVQTTCGAQNNCQKYDVYCGMPTITYAEVSSTHEPVTALAYMYFGSATKPKSGDLPRVVGNQPMVSDAWASNFRGPEQAVGHSARTQWEWTDDDQYGMLSNLGIYGAPYTYGRECFSIPRGKTLAPPVPRLTVKGESVYEDDECLDELTGIPGTGSVCNPDDLVGHFWMDRSMCNDQVFGLGLGAGWTTSKLATTDGSISKVRYRMYCYSCKNAWGPNCSAGIQY